jgi:hypothetical protein
MTLGGDYRFQVEFVMRSAWRLLALQDADPTSPSHGCFHLAYWRDKTSEFADARLQEAGATLGLLSAPAFDMWRDAGGPNARQLYAGFAAALGCLGRLQYADGSFDEWYKGERGFAATEFTTIAFGLAANFLGEGVRAAERERLAAIAGRACRWLATRDDAVKANHEAAAAALALGWRCGVPRCGAEETREHAGAAAARRLVSRDRRHGSRLLLGAARLHHALR